MIRRSRVTSVLEVAIWGVLLAILAFALGNNLLGWWSSGPEGPPDLPEFMPVYEFVGDADPGDAPPPPVLCPDGRQATMPSEIPDGIEVVDLDTGERYPDEEALLRASSAPGYAGQGRYRPSPEALCEAFPTVEPVPLSTVAPDASP